MESFGFVGIGAQATLGNSAFHDQELKDASKTLPCPSVSLNVCPGPSKVLTANPSANFLVVSPASITRDNMERDA